jgi:hypothetical protein
VFPLFFPKKWSNMPGQMTGLSWFIFAAGVVAETVLLWRIHANKMGRMYPYFTIYLWQVFLRTIVLFVLMKMDRRAYGLFYWPTEPLSVILRFLVIWDAFRHVFRFPHGFQQRAAKLVFTIFIVLAVLVAIFGVQIRGRAPMQALFTNIEIRASLVQAMLIATIFLLVNHYSVQWRRNAWGMSIGLGLYVSLATANFAALELFHRLLPLWQIIRPASFLAMLVIWVWALWVRDTVQVPLLVPMEEPGWPSLAWQWKRSWVQLRSTMRRLREI